MTITLNGFGEIENKVYKVKGIKIKWWKTPTTELKVVFEKIHDVEPMTDEECKEIITSLENLSKWDEYKKLKKELD